MKPTDAVRMGRALMNEHGLYDWTLGFDRAMRRVGRCSPSRKTITLSEYMVRLNDECHIRHTVLHEIAHALTPGDGHGPRFRAQCRALGIDGDRYHTGANLVVPQGSWIGICPVCGDKTHKFRKPKRRKSCGKCHPRTFDERYVKVWTNPGFSLARTMIINVSELEDDEAA